MVATLNNVPAGAEVWRIGGAELYLMYRAPKTGQPLLYYIPPDDRGPLFKDAQGVDRMKVDRDISRTEANAQGAIEFGTTKHLSKATGDPFESAMRDLEIQAKVEPWILDPEIHAIHMKAALEGREVSVAELQGTDWWQSKNEGQRAWLKLTSSDPKTAEQRVSDTRSEIEDLFAKSGWGYPPGGLVDYYAAKVAHGDLSATQATQEIRQEVDPYAPGASPFAGRKVPENTVVAQQNGKKYALLGGKAFLLTGPGQVSRFATGGVKPTAKEGKFMQKNGQFYFWDVPRGDWYRAADLGEIQTLQRLYGEAEEVHPGFSPEDWGIKGRIADRFEGDLADYIPRVEGSGQTIAEYFDSNPELTPEGATGNSGLVGVEQVRGLVAEWLGPFSLGWDQARYEEEAGKIRNGGPGAQEVLVDKLRKQLHSVLDGYDENRSWEDISSPWASMVQAEWGEPIEATDPFLLDVVRMGSRKPDVNKQQGAGAVQEFLRKEGLKRGLAKPTDEALGATMRAQGSPILNG